MTEEERSQREKRRATEIGRGSEVRRKSSGRIEVPATFAFGSSPRKIKRKGRVEVLIRPAKVRLMVSFDGDILKKIEDWRSSRRPIPSFSEACNELLGEILGVRKRRGKGEEK